MNYRIVDGRIETRSIEFHVTDHCNLTCRQCCTLSPILKHYCIEPAELRRDLSLLKPVLKPRFLKLSGGEPLLHPKLIECLEACREAELAQTVSVSTNGILLAEMPAEFWKLCDLITISVYPQTGVRDLIPKFEELALRWDCSLNIKDQAAFQTITPRKKRSSVETEQTFAECWMRERCHTVRAGCFYLCTRPIHLEGPHRQSPFKNIPDFSPQKAEAQGVRLHDGEELVEEIFDYLKREQPLESCFYCLGTSGERLAHRLLARRER